MGKQNDIRESLKTTLIVSSGCWFGSLMYVFQCNMLLFCIDIGITNMGVAYINAHSHDQLECIHAARVDITDFKCTKNCNLSHSAVSADWISHLIADYQTDLDSADVVLIERQPPMGHRCIEQLLFQAFRHKAILIHPRSFLCYFNISNMDYDDRKKSLVSRARRVFQTSSADVQAALQQERAHDVADAMLFAVYYVNRPELRHKFYSREHKNVIADAEAYFNQFIYQRPRKRIRRFH